MRSTLVALLMYAGLVFPGPVPAAEEVSGHATLAKKSIYLEGDRLSPSDLRLGKNELLVFESHALYPLAIRFTEPAGQAEKIHCELIGKGEGAAPWLLFTWDEKQRLNAVIPPGRIASVCALAPGDYSYVTERAGGVSAAIETGVTRANKGTITVR